MAEKELLTVEDRVRLLVNALANEKDHAPELRLFLPHGKAVSLRPTPDPSIRESRRCRRQAGRSDGSSDPPTAGVRPGGGRPADRSSAVRRSSSRHPDSLQSQLYSQRATGARVQARNSLSTRKRLLDFRRRGQRTDAAGAPNTAARIRDRPPSTNIRAPVPLRVLRATWV